MIKSVLIANRGEIACRIIRTAKRMGVRTIAIYSEADADALHVRLADEAHLVGPAAASDSYLRAGRILSVAKEAKAEAIHPGYGFLSENADFAAMTQEAGMVFVGPPASAITAMGLKDRAKQLLADAGVPVVPGYHGTNQTDDFLKRKAYETGYPVLIKAVAGGGGKGMRKVARALEFDDALNAARREAKAAFGNDDVLIEKFVTKPRHIEIQVFADTHGNVVHLFERDCSLQRRHQKVIEEAPAPGMTTTMREAMGKAACDAARAVGYVGAGTVEFIVDGKGGLSEDGFFFMEMNTRLQVEHPVTEMITGVDLVEWQLRVASGEKLPKTQDELTIAGHAVEARIYAEDPDNGFLPSIGKLVAFAMGDESESVRVDTGVEAGDMISPHYDPMIAKLIVHGPSRAEAMELLEASLRRIVIAGPTTNTAFLARLCADKDFLAGRFDTSLIDQKLDDLIDSEPVSDDVLAAGIATLHDLKREQTATLSALSTHSPWRAADAYQLSGQRKLQKDVLVNGTPRALTTMQQGETISLVGSEGQTELPSKSALTFVDEARIIVLQNGRQTIIEEMGIGEGGADAGAAGDGVVRVPMHGKIISLTVAEGDEVEQGDILFAVEAMKMEHSVIAPIAGTVRNLELEVGMQAEAGLKAMELEGAEVEE